MKRFYLLFIFLSLVLASSYSQISYGGKPFFLQTIELRSSHYSGFFQMPSFDVDSLLIEDALYESDMRGSYRFAHKFHTDIEKKRDALLTVLADGTRIWTLTFRSEGAYSLNFLLEKVSFPEEGRLFIYNTDYSHVIGQFDRRNISDKGILPIRPVSGETVIIEYSEPGNSEFEGNFVVTEVNHDYRDFLRREPGTDKGNHSCMPDALCEEANPDLIRSTVLLIINGNISCTGTLINNTEDDGSPYVLTAVHCLNNDITIERSYEYYVGKAATVIAFFNYNRTVCGSQMKGTEEMSIAVSSPLVIMEKRDVALLGFQTIPPKHYNPYYAGWSLSLETNAIPYSNLHHPEGSVKKYSLSNTTLRSMTLSLSNPRYSFATNAHLETKSWNIGSTDKGSSGSPLFDKDGLIVGGLTAGASTCSNSGTSNGGSDYFFSFARAWGVDNEMGQLETFLNPGNKEVNYWTGYHPYAANPVVRLNNIDYGSGNGTQRSELKTPASGFVFGGNNSEDATEFAEAFHVEGNDVELLGAYLLIPPMPYSFTEGVKISVYEGVNSPEKLIASYDFHPQYLDYTNNTSFSLKDKTTNLVGTENFILFDEGIRVREKFFISYRIPSPNAFLVYNAEFEDSENNSAWIKNPDETWIEATNYPYFEKPAALSISALVSGYQDASIELPGKAISQFPMYYDSDASALVMRTPNTYSGSLRIYAATGQLIEEYQLVPGRDQYAITSMKKGSIGIIRILIDNKNYSMKFIY